MGLSLGVTLLERGRCQISIKITECLNICLMKRLIMCRVMWTTATESRVTYLFHSEKSRERVSATDEEVYSLKENNTFTLINLPEPEKSLYGLNQSSRNWNKVLLDFQNNFVQNQADHHIYTRETEHDKVIMGIWIDDLIIAASDENALNVVKDLIWSDLGIFLELILITVKTV